MKRDQFIRQLRREYADVLTERLPEAHRNLLAKLERVK